MCASWKGHTEIFKILVKQEGININAKDIKTYYLDFISIILDFEIIFGNSSNYYGQH